MKYDAVIMVTLKQELKKELSDLSEKQDIPLATLCRHILKNYIDFIKQTETNQNGG